MPVAVVDTTVLYAAADRSDQWHADALPILTGIDAGDLPEAVVVDFVLAETMNGLVRNVSHAAAVDYLDRIEGNARFSIGRVSGEAFATGKSIFRRHDRLSLVDGVIAGHMRDRGIEYLYSFDAGFDGLEGVARLSTADDPFTP